MPVAVDNNSDTIRILVSSDNHVGYEERDPIRKNDSANSFNEVMEIARERDVDMILLAGDLFHENKPSRQSLYQVIRSLRANCLGPKPCQLEILSDQSEAFEGYFNYVNYEDPDINVAIPVFSIHGNHDDPTGDGHLAALDVLHETGLINYYGRIRDSATIDVRPVLIQKGGTKLALYGMSNVRDERLFHTFKDGKVTFHQPTQQGQDWFNLLSVHQNRHAYTSTSYLDETLLPESMDLVIWGHEHECLIEPQENNDTGFKIIQPGSTVATSLVPGEARQKMVTILSITGKEFEHEPIALKTVRPFKYREIELAEDPVTKNLATKVANRDAISKRLKEVIEEMIEEAREEWLEVNAVEGAPEDLRVPEPLIRLRVEYSSPEKGTFDCENPRRLSNAFQGKVANQNDVVYFWKKKKTRQSRISKVLVPDIAVTEQLSSAGLDTVVQQFLSANPLIILPKNHFGEAIFKYVDKDEKAALESFVEDQHEKQKSALLELEVEANAEEMEKAIESAIEVHRTNQEETFVPGTNTITAARPKKKPMGRPEDWDSEEGGTWQAAENDVVDSDEVAENLRKSTPAPVTRGRGRGRGRGATASTSSRTATAKTRVTAAASKQTTSRAKPSTATKQGTLNFATNRSRTSKLVQEDSDVEMIDEPEEGLFVTQPSNASISQMFRDTQASLPAARPTAPPKRPVRSVTTTQRSRTGTTKAQPFNVDLSDDINDSSDDDEDAFEPVSTSKARSRR